MDGTVRIKGGIPLKGEVEPIPNKNSLMASLPAALLADGGVLYKNLPKSSDVNRILQIYRSLNAKIVRTRDSGVLIDCERVSTYRIDPKIASEFRGAFMFAGPLLARFGKAEVPIPGGCILGMRSIAAHLSGFRKLGISVEYKDGFVRLTAPRE